MDVVSVLDAVTVYRREAVCVRRARVAAAGERSVRFAGLPLALDAGSLRAWVIEGPAGLRVLEVQAGFDVALAAEVDVPAETAALEQAQDAAARLETALGRLDSEIEELEGLRPKLPELKRAETPREAPVAAMLALTDLVDGRLAAAQGRRRGLRKELEAAREAVTLRQRRLAEASTALSSARTRVQRTAVATLSEAVPGPCELALEYVVPGVRWAPSYELRLAPGLGEGALTMRAAITQATGEDWNGVTLALSTASLSRSAELPVLKAIKIGRAQPAPARSGWRDPPPGLDDLFAGYDAAQAGHRPRVDTGRSGFGAASAGGFDEDDAEGTGVNQARPQPKRRAGRPAKKGAAPERARHAPAPMRDEDMASMAEVSMPPPAPMAAMPLGAMAPMAGGAPPAAMRMMSRQAAAPEPPAEEEEAPPPEPAPLRPEAGLLDYQRLVMGAPGGPGRGRLRPASGRELALAVHVNLAVQVDVAVLLGVVDHARAGARKVDALAVPARCQEAAPLDHFDHRYDCAHRVDVPATGAWTTVPVMACAVGLRPTYVTVPAVEEHVFRTLEVRNGSGHALLPGPVEVTVGDELLLTSVLPGMPAGAEGLRLGLGVEEAIKVARRTRFRESSGGLLGGKSVLAHELEIELNNRLGSPATIEVRERVPVPEPGSKDVEVEESAARPGWEKVDEPLEGVLVPGLRRWRVTVPAGQRVTLTAQYNVRIPSDKVLVGGNRRS